MITLKLNPSRRELRVFGLILGPFLALIGWYLSRRFESPPTFPIMAGVGALAFVLAVAVPIALKPIYVAWTTATFPIGWVVSHVVLALVYYGVLTPIALALRLSGRDPMGRRFDRAATTYWVRRAKQRELASYFRMY